MKEKNRLVKIIKKYISDPYKNSIITSIRPAIRLKTIGGQNMEIGKTKLGGIPDMPKNTSWASSIYNKEILSFIGQVNLKEINDFDEINLLPEKGMLYFFLISIQYMMGE